jgi:type VI protein secretion system component VasK
MRRLRLLGVASGVILAGAAMAALVVFLHGQGLDRASLWSGVLTLFLSVIAAAAAVWGIWLAAAKDHAASRNDVNPSIKSDCHEEELKSSEGTSKDEKVNFEVHTGRDSYSAQEMTIYQRSDDGDPPRTAQ